MIIYFLFFHERNTSYEEKQNTLFNLLFFLSDSIFPFVFYRPYLNHIIIDIDSFHTWTYGILCG